MWSWFSTKLCHARLGSVINIGNRTNFSNYVYTSICVSPRHVHGGWSLDYQSCVGVVVFTFFMLHGVSIFCSSLLRAIIEVNIVSELPIKFF